MRRPRILVMGDAMLDVYKHCVGARVSPESPSLIGRLQRTSYFPGGAANVASNLATLGARVQFIYVCQSGESNTLLQNSFPYSPEPVRFTNIEPPVNTALIRKTRFVISDKQVFREDLEPASVSDLYFQKKFYQKVIGVFGEAVREFDPDCVVLSDYLKGCLVAPETTHYISQRGGLVFVDTKDKDWRRFTGAFCIKVNQFEFANVNQYTFEDAKIDERAVLRRFRLGNIVVTRGEEGMSWYGSDIQEMHLKPEHTNQTVDVTGAGDTVLAALAYRQATHAIEKGVETGTRNLPFQEDTLKFASVAAGIAVSHPGTTSVYGVEVLTKFRGTDGKIFVEDSDSIVDLNSLIRCWKSRNYTIAFTNGCFDLFHTGHMNIINKCSNLADKVVVAINNNESISKLKGSTRPIVDEIERARLLAAMEVVDAVIIFNSVSPLKMIELVSPDFLVKGDDYRESDIIGSSYVRDKGGKVVIVPRVSNSSTTEIISKVFNNHSKDVEGTR